MRPAQVRLERAGNGLGRGYSGMIQSQYGMVTSGKVLQGLLELVEVDAVPGEEALPAVLAVVLVDQGEVVVAARVLRPLVEPVELAEGEAQLSSWASDMQSSSCAAGARRADTCTRWATFEHGEFLTRNADQA